MLLFHWLSNKKSTEAKRHAQRTTRNIDLRQFHFPKTNLPVSSDIIESLFGCFKSRLERNPQADMNRSVLLIPALCGGVDEQVVVEALKHTLQCDLKTWEAVHVPDTIAKKRQVFCQFSNPKIREILST